MKENKEKSSHKTNNGDGKGKNNDTKGEQKKKGKNYNNDGIIKSSCLFFVENRIRERW